MDGFLAGANDEFAIRYYAEPDLGFVPAAARAFTTCDHYFCSLLGPTIPNRSYQWAAQSAGIKTNSGMIDGAFRSQGFPWPTIFDRMRAAGLEARYSSATATSPRRSTRSSASPTRCVRRSGAEELVAAGSRAAPRYCRAPGLETASPCSAAALMSRRSYATSSSGSIRSALAR